MSGDGARYAIERAGHRHVEFCRDPRAIAFRDFSRLAATVEPGCYYTAWQRGPLERQLAAEVGATATFTGVSQATQPCVQRPTALRRITVCVGMGWVCGLCRPRWRWLPGVTRQYGKRWRKRLGVNGSPQVELMNGGGELRSIDWYRPRLSKRRRWVRGPTERRRTFGPTRSEYQRRRAND